MRTRVPLFKLPRHSGKYIKGVLKSGWYAPGPLGELLKKKLGEMFTYSPEQIVLTASATASFGAVLGLIRWAGSNLQVAISDHTWAGMYRTLEQEGFHENTAGVADVRVDSDLGGATTHNIPIGPQPPFTIQDCSHGWIPRQGYDFSIASFYPTKLVPGAEGGVIFCKSRENAALLEKQINCGLGALWALPGPGHSLAKVPGRHGQGRAYDVVGHAIGRKATMPDLLAAINLEALEGHREYAEGIAKSWRLLEAAAMGLGIRYVFQDVQPYLFQVELPNTPSVPRARAALLERGVETAWNFPPAPLLTVPCWPGMAFSTAVGIMKEVRKVLDEQHRLLGREMEGRLAEPVRPELAGQERAPAGA